MCTRTLNCKFSQGQESCLLTILFSGPNIVPDDRNGSQYVGKCLLDELMIILVNVRNIERSLEKRYNSMKI